MDSHDAYGKAVIAQASGRRAFLDGPSVEVDYGTASVARIDATVNGEIAIEVESRTSKQVRGAVLDLICHPYRKKLLLILPVHMSNPRLCAEQCRNILRRFCAEKNFRVVILAGSGKSPALDEDATRIAAILRELGAIPPAEES